MAHGSSGEQAILDRLLKLAAFLSVVAYGPSLYGALLLNLWILAAVDTGAFLFLFVIAFSGKISYGIKYVSLVLLCLLVGLTVLMYTGPHGAGYIWLIGAVVFSALFGQIRIILFSLSATLGVMILYAWASSAEVLRHGQPLFTVLIITANLVVVSSVLAYVTYRLVSTLRKEAEEKRIIAERLAAELETNKAFQEKLNSSLTEKTLLLKELDHRVKNNLQVIISLLRLEIGEAGGDEKSRLSKILFRVRAIASVHHLLHADSGRVRVDAGRLLPALAEILGDSSLVVQGAAPEKPGFPLFLEPDDAVRLALAVVELCSLVSDSRGARPVKEAVRLSLGEKGRGIELFFPETPTLPGRNGNPLGFALAEGLVEQAGARLETERKKGEGAGLTVRIVVPER